MKKLLNMFTQHGNINRFSSPDVNINSSKRLSYGISFNSVAKFASLDEFPYIRINLITNALWKSNYA